MRGKRPAERPLQISVGGVAQVQDSHLATIARGVEAIEPKFLGIRASRDQTVGGFAAIHGTLNIVIIRRGKTA
jgi:hypothetical protein